MLFESKVQGVEPIKASLLETMELLVQLWDIITIIRGNKSWGYL